MFDYKVIVQKEFSLIDKILQITSNAIIIERLNDIKICISAGEWQIAIDSICSNLYEFDIKIDKEAYELIKEIVLDLEMNLHDVDGFEFLEVS